MGPKYVLIHYNVRARAEPIRWMFELKGVEYEDRRLNNSQWAEFKSQTPFEQLPVLEVDGKMICETTAILFYLAREFGYDGETSMATAECAMIAGCVEDTMIEFMKWRFPSSQEVVEPKKKFFLENSLPKLLRFLSCQIKGKDWLTGSKMTVADIIVARALSDWPEPARDIIQTFPDVQAVVDKILAFPAIQAWIEKRPQHSKK